MSPFHTYMVVVVIGNSGPSSSLWTVTAQKVADKQLTSRSMRVTRSLSGNGSGSAGNDHELPFHTSAYGRRWVPWA